MISRRFDGHSLGRLGAELIVVFVGVLLAFGAENWREARADRAEARAGLSLMLQDLAADSAALEAIARSLERKTLEIAWLVEQRDRESVPTDSLSQAMWTFNTQTVVTLNRAAWEGMETSNRIPDITSESLRIAVVGYYQATHGRYSYWEGVTQDLGNDLLDDLYDHVRLVGGREVGTLWPTAEQRLPLASSWREFRNDLPVQNRMVMFGRVIEFFAGFTRSASAEATELMQAIRMELGEA